MISGLDDLTIVACDDSCDASSGDVVNDAAARSDAAGADSEADASDSRASDTFDGAPRDALLESGSIDVAGDSGSDATDSSPDDATADRDADESGMVDVRAGS
jgi:hypothetical protein